MSLILRGDKNSKLTIAELDGNFQYLESLTNNVSLQQVLDFNHDLVDGNNFQGTGAGLGNTGSNVNGIGQNAARNNVGDYVNGIGAFSAQNNEGTYVNGLGVDASYDNTGNNVNGIGESAAKGNSGNHVSAIGREAALNNTGDNVIALGSGAATGNTLSGMFIISNTELPSYTDYTSASQSITPTGIPGNTYLYYDQTNNTIGAVRL